MSGAGPHATTAWLPESVRVERWRLSEFIRMGFDVDAAQALAESEADLHRVESLLLRACSKELALAISL